MITLPHGGLNGQQVRQGIFRDLVKTCNFDLIIETGTSSGHTSGWLANESGLPVYTCDTNADAIEGARKYNMELDVLAFCMDSRKFLELMAKTHGDQRVFFYLDAHWGDLPLDEELSTIGWNWKNFVCLIDDFQVPGDDGYGFDDYPEFGKINLELIKWELLTYGLKPLFPKTPSSEETGAKRGSCWLGSRGDMAAKLRQHPLLRS